MAEAKEKEVRKSILCRNCGAENPLKAYCCLNCFKVLRPKSEVPWYRMAVRPTLPVLLAMCAVGFFGILMVKHWMESIEAQVTLNLKTTDYNVSVVADKRKKESNVEIQAGQNPAPQTPANVDNE